MFSNLKHLLVIDPDKADMGPLFPRTIHPGYPLSGKLDTVEENRLHRIHNAFIVILYKVQHQYIRRETPLQCFRILREGSMKPVFIPVVTAMIILAATLPGFCIDHYFDRYLRVPTEFPTIQSAIDAAVDGDTVLVYAGTYSGEGNRDIDFTGKAITVKSAHGPDYTVIDCSSAGRGFQFVSLEDHSSWLDGFTIDNCDTPSGGGGIVCVESSPTISNCIITRSATWSGGGGIACYRCFPIIFGCRIYGNSAYGSGGGIYCHASYPAIIECVITGNRTDIQGGGISCGESAPFIKSCTISDNEAEEHGGGVSFFLSDPWIARCTVAGNRTDGSGGGICIMSSSPIIENCTVSKNTSIDHGGGISCFDCGPEIKNCTISENTTSRSGGGGIYCTHSSPLITNCTNAGNSANSDGGGVRCSHSDFIIKNCTITENATNRSGGAIYCFSSDAVLTNCILWNNSKDEILAQSGKPELTYSDIEGGWAGEGNIDINPLFIDVENKNFHLEHDSPCIDAGIDCEVYEDIDGDSRPQKDGFDIGSDEVRFEGPVLYISPRYFYTLGEYGGYEKDDSLTVTNMGTEIIEFTMIPGDEQWLSLGGETSGTIPPGDTVFVFLQYDIAALDIGVHNDTIKIQSNDPSIPLQAIPVTLEILYGGTVHVPGDVSTIQEAIDLVLDGTTVLVADGTYSGAGNKNIDFRGKPITVKSENGPDRTVIDCEKEGRGFSFFTGEGASSRLEGFTIKEGNSAEGFGGGLYCSRTSPTISDCIITGNAASEPGYGGGIYCDNSSPTIQDCIISDNTVFKYGGGVYCYESNPAIVKCAISGNRTEKIGGGIYCKNSSPGISNCFISDNSAGEYGGGIYCRDSNPNISSCIVSNNTAAGYGGGIYCLTSSPIIINCTITRNSAYYGGGIRCYRSSSPYISNCILWDDTPQEILILESNPTVTYSDIEGGWEGEGNIDADPFFVSRLGFDYLLSPQSPCIDSGDPVLEDALYDWHPLCPDWYVNGIRSDMGAYGGPGNIDWFR